MVYIHSRVVGILVSSRYLDEVIKVVKKATVYKEDKGSSSKSKTETTEKGDGEMVKGPREVKGCGDPTRAMDLRDRSK